MWGKKKKKKKKEDKGQAEKNKKKSGDAVAKNDKGKEEAETSNGKREVPAAAEPTAATLTIPQGKPPAVRKSAGAVKRGAGEKKESATPGDAVKTGGAKIEGKKEDTVAATEEKGKIVKKDLAKVKSWSLEAKADDSKVAGTDTKDRKKSVEGQATAVKTGPIPSATSPSKKVEKNDTPDKKKKHKKKHHKKKHSDKKKQGAVADKDGNAKGNAEGAPNEAGKEDTADGKGAQKGANASAKSEAKLETDVAKKGGVLKKDDPVKKKDASEKKDDPAKEKDAAPVKTNSKPTKADADVTRSGNGAETKDVDPKKTDGKKVAGVASPKGDKNKVMASPKNARMEARREKLKTKTQGNDQGPAAISNADAIERKHATIGPQGDNAIDTATSESKEKIKIEGAEKTTDSKINTVTTPKSSDSSTTLKGKVTASTKSKEGTMEPSSKQPENRKKTPREKKREELQAKRAKFQKQKEENLKKRAANADPKKHQAATKLQSQLRGKKARQELEEMQKEGLTREEFEERKVLKKEINNEAAVKLQATVRGKKARNELKEMKEEGLTRAEYVERKELKKEAAVKVQAQIRGKKARNELKEMKEKSLTRQEYVEREGRAGGIAIRDRNRKNSGLDKKRSSGIKRINKRRHVRSPRAPASPPPPMQKLRREERASMGKSSRRRVTQPPRSKQIAKQREKIKRLQAASGIELKALPFSAPASLAQATQMIATYRQRELDLLEFQQLQAEKMSSLRQKAEKTVGSLSQEIEMMSADLADQRTQLAQEIKLRRKEEKNRRTAEADAERLRRELRGERDELRLAVAKETQLQIERDRLDAVLSKVGAGALDDLEARLQSSEERRWQAEAEIEKLRTELNWQTNGRMDERLAVSQLEEELNTVRQAKRRVEVRRMQLEESLEQAMVQLRAKKRECTDYRKRLDAMLQQKGTGVLKGRFRGRQMMEKDVMRQQGIGVGAAGGMGGRGNPRTRRAVLPPANAKKGPNNSDLAALRRKITTLRARVGGGGAGFV